MINFSELLWKPQGKTELPSSRSSIQTFDETELSPEPAAKSRLNMFESSHESRLVVADQSSESRRGPLPLPQDAVRRSERSREFA